MNDINWCGVKNQKPAHVANLGGKAHRDHKPGTATRPWRNRKDQSCWRCGANREPTLHRRRSPKNRTSRPRPSIGNHDRMLGLCDLKSDKDSVREALLGNPRPPGLSNCTKERDAALSPET